MQHDIPTLRILESHFVSGSKHVIHHVQLLLQNGDTIRQWMPNETLNQWRQKVHGYTIQDGIVSEDT